MKIKVKLFAQLEALAGTKEIVVDNIKDTDELQDILNKMYPEFRSQCYVIAVEKDIIQRNTELSEGNTVAFLPPYAGG